ncbi:amidase [Phreatobacter sp. AB_2022a]|uniref:amidase n=1 Tax=Phreatobacter sp. AB_2022a TaxID=3003134 RepID=UPI0022871EBD|nr:amidase family protein [Phreatobacter sp. AB_2022a]MCZ0738137.1 amidase family protein [Phreatobacter sp. AB_2022a]
MAADLSLIEKSATDILKLLKKDEVSPLDLLDTLEARIAAVDGKVNALPTLCFDRARKHARALMKRPKEGRGLLMGMPVPIKDLTDVEGVLSTQGSPIFADHVPTTSNILVENLEARGGIVYAKSNTPEFGAGANTFNEVFGRTLNPYNTKLSAAGSSGGAAVALATGQAWLAHGSDMGGSLRNPASFCGIVGMRPSPGRVATTPGTKIDASLGIEGPMARTVADLALLLDAMSGDDHRDPRSLPAPRRSFRAALRSGWKPKRVAYSPDLGITPVDPEVKEITRKAAERFAGAGVTVEEAHPDFSEVHECFGVLRAYAFAVTKAELLRTHRDKLKPEVIWNIEKGMQLTMAELARAEAQRQAMLQRALAFFDSYDLILTPATIVAAYPVEQRYVAECDGFTFPDYVQWLSIAYAFTTVSSPALSLPCGFTRDGRPVGLQIAARPHGEDRILAGAKMLEDVLGLDTVKPIDPRG